MGSVLMKTPRVEGRRESLTQIFCCKEVSYNKKIAIKTRRTVELSRNYEELTGCGNMCMTDYWKFCFPSLLLASRSPSSAGSRTSELGDSRSHTPSEDDIRNRTLTKDEDELAERSGKDSPTPDRESLKIDEMESLSHQNDNTSSG